MWQIHWQVAQATSLQNIRFEMVVDKTSNNKQQGIFMDNGSGKQPKLQAGQARSVATMPQLVTNLIQAAS